MIITYDSLVNIDTLEEEIEPPLELDSGFQGYYINSNGEREYFHKGKIRKTKMKVKDFTQRNSRNNQRSRDHTSGSGDPPILAQRSIQREASRDQTKSETLSPIRTESRPFPKDFEGDFDPFDLRKDLVVPLFNADRTSLNELIELDKPITLDDLERKGLEPFSSIAVQITTWKKILNL